MGDKPPPITAKLDLTLSPVTLEATASVQSLTEALKGPFDAYMTAVGRVAHTWNHLHETLAEIFAQALDADASVAFAVWYSTESDRAQQKMLKAALEAISDDRWAKLSPRAKGDLIWLVERASNLGEDRNNAIHAPCSVIIKDRKFSIIASDFQGNPRAKKLAGKDIFVEFEFCETWARTLRQFGQEMQAFLWQNMFVPDSPWPDRPSKPDRKPRSAPQDPQSR